MQLINFIPETWYWVDSDDWVPRRPLFVTKERALLLYGTQEVLADELTASGCKVHLAVMPEDVPTSCWQPIETAPKDGTDIVLRCPNGHKFAASWVSCAFLPDGWYCGVGATHCQVHAPIEWCALPGVAD